MEPDMHSVVLVDDDREIRELLTGYLEKSGFSVSAFPSAEALMATGLGASDLVILDVGLPGMDGLQLCRELRKTSDLPIIMLTAASDDIDRILGLELGADDYMGKPFNPRELLARLKALLRRSAVSAIDSTEGAIKLNAKQRVAYYNGVPLDLTGAEFDLLQALVKRPGEIVGRDQLSLDLKGRTASAFDRSIDTLVSRLRSKLTQHSEHDPIKSVRGKGYLLVIV